MAFGGGYCIRNNPLFFLSIRLFIIVILMKITNNTTKKILFRESKKTCLTGFYACAGSITQFSSVILTDQFLVTHKKISIMTRPPPRQ